MTNYIVIMQGFTPQIRGKLHWENAGLQMQLGDVLRRKNAATSYTEYTTLKYQGKQHINYTEIAQ